MTVVAVSARRCGIRRSEAAATTGKMPPIFIGPEKFGVYLNPQAGLEILAQDFSPKS
jgi:hypothetical protein